MRPDIRPGGTFPDYSLPDHLGTVRTLSGLQGRDPLILTLAHGNYCPREHQQHLELAANYSKVAVAYTQVATIATGLREAWDAGDYSKFHGWDRRSPGSTPTSYV
jgi:hypothetical protein